MYTCFCFSSHVALEPASKVLDISLCAIVKEGGGGDFHLQDSPNTLSLVMAEKESVYVYL
jgi:hypothetical protein